MKKKLTLVSIIVFIVLLFLYILYFNSETVVYIGKSNAILKNHEYKKSYDGSGIVYIIRYEPPITKFEHYKLNKNENLDLVIPKDTEFTVSLYSNSTRPYKWKINQGIDSKIIEYKGNNVIEPHDFIFTSKKGYSSRRQNFNFKAKAVGNEKFVLKYMDIDNSEVDNEMIINIEVK